MSVKASFLAVFYVLLCLAAPSAWAQAVATIDPEFVDIDRAASEDPSDALARLDALLEELEEEDPRQVYDLFDQRTALLLALDRKAEAAALLAELAGYAAAQRDVIQRDPIPLYLQAAQLFKELNDPLAARDAQLAILDEQRAGGWSGDVLAETLEEIARLSDLAGRSDDAEGYRQSAADARDPLRTPPSRGVGDGYRVVDVYYATDRARSGEPEPASFYGSGRGMLELGIATVTVPDVHQPGQIEAPSIWRLEFGPNAARHVVLRSVTPVEADTFFSEMNQEFSDTGWREAFVFIHGYNVTFDQAAKRAAQIAHDMNYVGVPILYSWPSRGRTSGYVSDAAVVRLSGRRLSAFLDDLLDRTEAQTIHIVAHSMGNRALTDALELLALRRGIVEGDPPLFGQILFAAPDVDAGLFAEMLPTIRPLARRLTLYASEQDWALAASRRLHGDAPRAGQGGSTTLIDPLLDSVDMSELGQDMLAHSYFANDSSALGDMMALFWRNAAPDRRCGLVAEPMVDALRPVWFYRVGRCEDQSIVNLIANLQRAEVNNLLAAERVVETVVPDAETARALMPIVAKLLED